MVPKYDELYIPVLNALSDEKIHTNKEVIAHVTKEVAPSEEDLQKTTSSGYCLFNVRTHWAVTYLRKAGLVSSPKRGCNQITKEGKKVISNPPAVLDNKFLSQYPSFQDFSARSAPQDKEKANPSEEAEHETPTEMIEQAAATINAKLADDLMHEIFNKSPSFFEGLVVDLLRKMGYGGSASDAGVVTKSSGDGGIDGIIREDKLGFDQIYIQAKRWEQDLTVTRPEIQKFYGALAGVGASKGLFITTSKFSDTAQAYAKQQHIVLVDGERLTKLMIDYNVGVSTVATYQVKTIDSDYFTDEFE